jgi:isopenicillin-N N-acyltransferase like protein
LLSRDYQVKKPNLRDQSPMRINRFACFIALAAVFASACQASAAESSVSSAPGQTTVSRASIGGSGYRTAIGNGDARIPVVLVRGTPYEMGWHLGHLTRDDIHQVLPKVMGRFKQSLNVTDRQLADTWARTVVFGDDRFKQELAGLADGADVPLALLQAAHAIPLLMPYSCSSVAAWGKATDGGHLYQTRNLDWKLGVGLHDFPVVVVYLPDRGIPHVVPTFASVIGAHTGMNARGIVLAEMGDSPAREAPYDLDAPQFMTVFRTLLYDADSLDKCLEIFKGVRHTKRYHYVFGDGRNEHRAVKIRAHSTEPPGRRIIVWKDNDPTDEFAPRILENVVYNDEGRGAFPLLKRDYSTLSTEKMIAIANSIPIRGGNVVDVVYDATALQLWVSYAKGKQEAYLRPYVHIDLARLGDAATGKLDVRQILATK